MKVRVLIFGPLARVCGAREVVLELPEGATASEVNRALVLRFGESAGFSWAGARLAVNGAFAGDGHVLQDGDEVAVIEMVGGG